MDQLMWKFGESLHALHSGWSLARAALQPNWLFREIFGNLRKFQSNLVSNYSLKLQLLVAVNFIVKIEVFEVL
jgi:hypothetical protein